MTEALILSLKLSLLTTLILILLSLPLAYLLSYRSFLSKGILEALLLSPIVLPPTVLGFYLIIFLSEGSFVGKVLESIAGEPLLFSFKALLIGSLIYSLPFGIFPVRDAFQSVPKGYLEVAYVYGHSELEAFFRVVLPNAWGYLHSLGARLCPHHGRVRRRPYGRRKHTL